MNERDFNAKLGDLISQIDQLPPEQRTHLHALAQDAKERHGKMKQTVAELQESMDYLRLSIKYLLFDLEATRRENAYLRKLLEKHANPPADAGDNEPND